MAGKPLTPGEVQKQFGYTPQQMRKFEGEGVIQAQRTPGGHRRYDPDAVSAMFAKAKEGELSQRESYQEWGTTGLRQWGGSIYEERLRALRGREGRREYREMRLNDPVVSAVFFAILNAIKQTSIRIEPASEKPPDREVAEFTDTCFFDMSFTWQDQLTFAVEPTLEQGFSLLEVIYKRRLGLNPPKYIEDPARSMFDDGRIGWRKLPPRPAETLAQGSEWQFDENGGVQGIVQQPETTFEGEANTIPIPIQKLLHFRTTVHPANNPEGLPIHRAMYLPYYYSRNISELEGIGIERDLAGLPVAYMGDDTTRSGDDSDYATLQDVTTNIRVDEQMGVVIPFAKMGEGAAEGKGVLLELLSPSNTGGKRFDTNEILDRYDRLKAVSVLAQFIMLGMNNVGSYALSKHQGDIFILAISSFLQGIADVFNRHAIPKLILMNTFSGITGFPKLVFSTLGVPDLVTIADFINKLVDKAVLTPDLELERHLRQMADLPEIQESIRVNEQPEPTDDEMAKGLKKKRLRKQADTTGLSDAGVEALGETEDLEEEIGSAWEEFKENALGGMAIGAAILLFKNKVVDLFRASYTILWELGREGAADLGLEQPQINSLVDEALSFLDGFMGELRGELVAVGADLAERASLFDRRRARALMYAGGAWAAYNLAKIFGRPEEELWVWDGAPLDERSCSTCVVELPKPPRPLSQMRIPGRDTICLTSCRHEVRRATEAEIRERRRIGVI